MKNKTLSFTLILIIYGIFAWTTMEINPINFGWFGRLTFGILEVGAVINFVWSFKK